MASDDQNLQWSPQQETALRRGAEFVRRIRRAKRRPGNPERFVVTGLAGTGKSTLARHLVGDMPGTVYTAPTGRAARNLRIKGCPGAMTLHRALYKVTEKTSPKLVQMYQDLAKAEREAGIPDFTIYEEGKPSGHPEIDLLRQLIDEELVASKGGLSFNVNPTAAAFSANLLVIEEASMVGSYIARDIIDIGVPLLIIGDPGQLQPVKDKAVLLDSPDIVLTEIHRQAADSGILRLAHEIRNTGRFKLQDYGPDCRVIQHGQTGGDRDLNTRLVMQADQMIVGTHDARKLANATLRCAKGRNGSYPVIGDKLICKQNNHDLDIMNGSQWTCVDPGRRGASIIMDMEIQSLDEPDLAPLTLDAHSCIFVGKDVNPNKRRDAEHFDFAEAVTTHASQGSQWDRIYALNEARAFRGQEKELLYTMVTRGARDVTLVDGVPSYKR